MVLQAKINGSIKTLAGFIFRPSGLINYCGLLILEPLKKLGEKDKLFLEFETKGMKPTNTTGLVDLNKMNGSKGVLLFLPPPSGGQSIAQHGDGVGME